MGDNVYVIGVGMVPFSKPSDGERYEDMGAAAARAALDDANIDYAAVGHAFAGYVYGDSTSGQAVLYGLGLTGIPIVNVNNNCSTGSSALWLARQAVASGEVDVALAVGFEQMQRGAIKEHWPDRTSPFARHDAVRDRVQGIDPQVPMAAQFFGGAGKAYADQYGLEPETLAAISVKSRQHAANNPYAVFRAPLTVEEVLASPHVHGLLTRLQCCPPTCGAAAAVLASEQYVRRHGLDARVRIRAQALTTDGPSSFESGDLRRVVGYEVTAEAARRVYEDSGVSPQEIPVVELHDCFTTNELLSYEALGLTPAGTAEKFIRDGENTYGGRVVTNPSGGLLSKGHPLGATGLAQCAELTWQLRGQAGPRQVDGARLALAHNLGLGSACVVTLFESVT